MGAFSYDGPLMKALTMMANMMIVSFYWIVGCLPVVTIVPSCAAMYHTMVKVVRGRGSGVTRDFFTCWKNNLRQGIPLTLMVGAFGLVMGFCLSFGYRNSQHSWVLAYFVIGCLLMLFFCEMVVWLPAVLSRFEGSLGTLLRLSLYFAMKKPLATLLMLVFLGITVFLVDFYPVLALILPAVYVDLVCGSVEKAMGAFQEQNIGTREEEEQEETLPEAGEISALEQARAMEETEGEDTDA